MKYRFKKSKLLFLICLLLCVCCLLSSCFLIPEPPEEALPAEPEPEPKADPEPEPQPEPEPEPVSLFADLGETLILTENYYVGAADEPYLSEQKLLTRIDLGGHILDLGGLSLTVAAEQFTLQNGILTNGSLAVQATGHIAVSDVQFSKAGFCAEADSIEADNAAFESTLTLRAGKIAFAGGKTEIQSYAVIDAGEITVDNAACPLPGTCTPSILRLLGEVDVSVSSSVPLICAVGTSDGSLTLRRGANVKLLTGEDGAELSVSIQPGANLLAIAADPDCRLYSERKVSYMPDAAVDYLIESLNAEAWETAPEITEITVGEVFDRLASLVGEEGGRDVLPFYIRWLYDTYRDDTVDDALAEIGMPEDQTLSGLLHDYYAYFVLAELLGEKAEAFFDEYGEEILAAVEAVDWETVGSDAENLLGAVFARLNEETDWIITEEDENGTVYYIDEVAFARTVRKYGDRSAASLIFEIAGLPTEDAEQIVSDLVPLLKRFPNTRLSGIALLINMIVSVIGLDFDEAQALRTGIYDAMDAILSATFGYEISFRELCRENGSQTLYEVLSEKEGVDISELSETYDGAIDWLEEVLTEPLSELRIGSRDFDAILDFIIDAGEKTVIAYRLDESGRLYSLEIRRTLTDGIGSAVSYSHTDGSPLSLAASVTTPLGDASFSVSVTEREITLSLCAFGECYERTYLISDLLSPADEREDA